MLLTGSSFFSAGATEKALSELADAESLTVVVGAGVAIESRLPSWSQLVAGLLERAARHVLPPKTPPDHRKAFAEWTVRSDGLLAAASIARALGQTDRDIAEVLYAATGATPLPGPSARALARLTSHGCELVTTNYDESLELAVTEQDPAARDASDLALVGPPGDGDEGVVHLHGVLRGRRAIGKVVLDEQDYFSLGDDAWQGAYVREALERGPCLFVGSSMTDPNLLRYLHRAERRHHHYAVLVRQADSYAAERDPDPAVEQARYAAAARRWGGLGVAPLQPEFFSDSAQLLYELLARRSGSTAGGFRSRLEAWIHDIERLYLSPDPAQFTERQDVLQNELQMLKERVREVIDHNTDAKSERFAVGLWVVRENDALLLVGNSDRAHRDVHTLDPVPLLGRSDWTAVEAFRSGTPLVRDVQHRLGTRWNTVIGFPISIETPEYGRLPAGVVTIAGTEPLDASALSVERLGPEAFDDLNRLATDYASRLLLGGPSGSATPP